MRSTAERGAIGPGGSDASALDVLRQFRRDREPVARCELCSAPIPRHPDHEHLLDPAVRQMACSCTACALLFPADAEKRYRRVPRRLRYLSGFLMSEEQWEDLAIPVAMAFFHTSAPGGEVRAFYPSPAGATESLLTLAGWEELVAANPVLSTLQPDVEALLVHRIGATRDYYLAPIDRCYELVGIIRLHWRGLSGGTEVWQRITGFFATLKATADGGGAGDA